MTMQSLADAYVELRPLSLSDAEALIVAASDGELRNLRYTVVPSRATSNSFLRVALDGQAAGTRAPRHRRLG